MAPPGPELKSANSARICAASNAESNDGAPKRTFRIGASSFIIAMISKSNCLVAASTPESPNTAVSAHQRATNSRSASAQRFIKVSPYARARKPRNASRHQDSHSHQRRSPAQILRMLFVPSVDPFDHLAARSSTYPNFGFNQTRHCGR